MPRSFLALVGLTLSLGACGLENTNGSAATDPTCDSWEVYDRDVKKCVLKDNPVDHDCDSWEVWSESAKKCELRTDCTSSNSCAPTGDNWCEISGVDSLTEIGYEVTANASTLGRGTWVNVGSKSGSNAKVRVDLTGPTNPVAVRLSAKTPSGRYLAEFYSNPVANATVKCRIGGSDITLEPRAVTGYSRGAEMDGSKSGSIPNPITTN